VLCTLETVSIRGCLFELMRREAVDAAECPATAGTMLFEWGASENRERRRLHEVVM